MTKLVTNKFRHNAATLFRRSLIGEEHFTAVGQPTAFVDDNNPPAPDDATQTSHYDVINNMIFGKHIEPDDTRIMIKRNEWVSGTIYDAYDHEDPDLFETNKIFFVVVDEGLTYSVFKCLSNAGGVASTSKPSLFETAADDESYMTADGYQWKYMYTITRAEFEQFATSSYIPVTANTSVTANAVSGAIDAIQITNGGTRYSAYHSGNVIAPRVGGNNQIFEIESSASSNTDFYKGSVFKIVSGPGAGQQRTINQYIVSGGVKRILLNQAFDYNDIPTSDSYYEISPKITLEGDGSGFEGRALVNTSSNSIYAVEISSRGAGYTWANAVVTSNTGILDFSNNAITANNAELRVIISPPGGHGSHVEAELGGTALCISHTYNSAESGNKIVDTNDFRTISIIKNPIFNEVNLEIALVSGSFTAGETVTQYKKTSYGTYKNTGVIDSANSSHITLKSVSGLFAVTDEGYSNNKLVEFEVAYSNIFNVSNSAVAQVLNLDTTNPGLYFDQTTTLFANTISANGFLEDEFVFQGDSTNGYNASGYVLSANTTELKLVNTKGVFNQSESNTTSGYIFGNTSLATADITAIKLPDLDNKSGEVLYIENIIPIGRSNGLSEMVKIILEF